MQQGSAPLFILTIGAGNAPAPRSERARPNSEREATNNVADTEKLLILVTHGLDEPEKATMPLVMAVGALASEVDVVVGLQEAGVELAVKGATGVVGADGYPTLAKVLADYRDLGGRLLACPLGLATRKLDSGQLVENAEVVAAGRFIVEISSASHVLVY
jgi:uncharacterized protein